MFKRHEGKNWNNEINKSNFIVRMKKGGGYHDQIKVRVKNVHNDGNCFYYALTKALGSRLYQVLNVEGDIELSEIVLRLSKKHDILANHNLLNKYYKKGNVERNKSFMDVLKTIYMREMICILADTPFGLTVFRNWLKENLSMLIHNPGEEWARSDIESAVRNTFFSDFLQVYDKNEDYLPKDDLEEAAKVFMNNINYQNLLSRIRNVSVYACSFELSLIQKYLFEKFEILVSVHFLHHDLKNACKYTFSEFNTRINHYDMSVLSSYQVICLTYADLHYKYLTFRDSNDNTTTMLPLWVFLNIPKCETMNWIGNVELKPTTERIPFDFTLLHSSHNSDSQYTFMSSDIASIASSLSLSLSSSRSRSRSKSYKLESL